MIIAVGYEHGDSSSNPRRDCISHSVNTLGKSMNLFSLRLWVNKRADLALKSCYIKVKETNLPYYLPIAGERIVGFGPFTRICIKLDSSATGRMYHKLNF